MIHHGISSQNGRPTAPIPPTPPRLNPIGEALRRAVLAMDHSGPVTVGQSRVASGDGWDMMGMAAFLGVTRDQTWRH